jgi:hypothetical protein
MDIHGSFVIHSRSLLIVAVILVLILAALALVAIFRDSDSN